MPVGKVPGVARTALLALCLGLSGCSALLPSSKETSGSGGGWQTYEDAQSTFERIVPGKTTHAELKELKLDPSLNPSVTLLHRAEVTTRFIPNSLITLADLDEGVRTCIEAREQCRAFEVNHVATQQKRKGNAALDIVRVYRETHTAGWRFTALILMKDGVVVYKLTGGQPLIHQIEAKRDNLAPLQALSARYLNADSLSNLASSFSRKDEKPSAPSSEPVTAFGARR